MADLDPRPDWTLLPAEFHYLVPAVERYGALMALSRPLPRRLKRREIAELRDLALRVGWNNHDLLLQSWEIEHSIAGHYREVELVEGLFILLDYLGFDVSDYGPKQEPEWTLGLWETLHYRVLQGHVDALMELVPEDEAFDVAVKALERAPEKGLADVAFFMLKSFQTGRPLDWIERHAHAVELGGPEGTGWPPWDFWYELATVSEISWARAEAWLERGRPLSLVALGALAEMAGDSESPVIQEVDPKLLDPVPFDRAARRLRDYAASDPTPWVTRKVEHVLERWSDIVGAR
ncbi:hypothetical protein [Paludisphaera sp.]|uniref:hypothetical protein n=1 Tax=Paludisphaera sp. TaxID=2017432 RepID=UPI00301DC5E6